MAFIPLNSSHVRGADYDPVKGLLRVHFRNGTIYEYPSVTQRDYEALITAPSAGSHIRHVLAKHPGGRKVSQ